MTSGLFGKDVIFKVLKPGYVKCLQEKQITRLTSVNMIVYLQPKIGHFFLKETRLLAHA